jgi:uncharacterized cupredoxin-like copper-binding protein
MMNRSRTKLLLLALSGVAGLFAAFVGFGSAATPQGVAKTKTTTIVVLAGKPSELAFKISKNSLIPPGTLIFKVTNAGRIAHDFKICVTPATKTANSCAKGPQTPLLQPGKSAMVKIVLTKAGTYEYLCTFPGHASAGMKGLIGVGVKYVAPVVVATTTHTTTTAPTTTAASPTTTSGTTTPTPTTTTAPTTTAPTTTAAAGNDGCAPGQTIQSSGNTDGDDDETGRPSDQDGCI